MEPANRNALALAAATRHPGMAAMIPHENFKDHAIVPALILFLLIGVLVAAAYQAWSARQRKGQSPTVHDDAAA